MKRWDLAEINEIQPSGWDLDEWLERLSLTANAKVATVLGSIPASSDICGFTGAPDEAGLNDAI